MIPQAMILILLAQTPDCSRPEALSQEQKTECAHARALIWEGRARECREDKIALSQKLEVRTATASAVIQAAKGESTKRLVPVPVAIGVGIGAVILGIGLGFALGAGKVTVVR